MSIIDNIKNPGIKYRPIPFWSWNDKLENDELQHQVDLMHDAGIGGYFMHARGGLLTEYMGDEWFDAVFACLDQGKADGMNSWAYDENGWPSGFGDGRVNGLGEKYQQKYLRFEAVDAAEFMPGNRTIAVYSQSGKKLDSLDGVSGELLHLYYDVNEFYVDTLDREVILTFVDKIYKEYYDKMIAAGRPASELSGFFTDEPQISRNGMPWSLTLPEQYKLAYGEDLLEVLPHLFMKMDNYRQTRYKIWKLITQLFMNNFMKPIHDFCEEHGWKITGHHVLEETYRSQIESNGAIMPQYQYYHIPGMDWLGRHIKPVTTPVQVASVCAQIGRKQILSETFALCGWNVKLEELKWIYQWQMVHGINLLCPHLESYSLKGIRKRDYPASLFRHEPWWDNYRNFVDYASRIGVILTEGEIKVDVLLLHGQSSAWLEYNANEQENKLIDEYFDSFNELSELLDSAHINYHYGDETLIEQYGKISGRDFVVGQQSYKVVVIPQLNNLSANQVELLDQFVAAGGKVLVVRDTSGDGVCYVGGCASEKLAVLSKEFIWFDTEAQLVASAGEYAECFPVVAADTEIESKTVFRKQLGQINVARRCFADFDGTAASVYYYVNNDLHNGFEADVYLPAGSVERFDPSTGEIVPIFFESYGDCIKIPHNFVPAGDLVLVAREGEAATEIDTVDYYRIAGGKLNSGFQTIDLNGKYDIKDMTENVLTLDYCSFSFDGELQEENEYVLVIQDRLLKKKRPVELEMNFKFNVADDYDMDNELFLIIERPELYSFEINGVEFTAEDTGFIYDPAFRRVAISKYVQRGENVIKLSTVFRQSDKIYRQVEAAAVFESEKNKLSYDMEIEAIYLAGQFGVATNGTFKQLEREAVRYSGDFALAKAPDSAELSRLQESNLPFFGGKVKLRREFDLAASDIRRRYLLYDKQKAIISKITINGKELETFLWKPFVASLDGFLKAGTNVIEIELTNSLRNVLGPHHLEEGESYAVGPSSFYKEDGVFACNWAGGYIPWDNDYCLVEFGVDNLRIV